MGYKYIEMWGGVVPPRETSFTRQLKSSGTHIWYLAEGRSKDSIVDDIYVLHSGKMTQYQIFHDNITLGQLSKLNDNDIIQLAKNQDKQYFEDAPEEIKNCFSQKTYNGLMVDIAGTDNKEFRSVIKGGPAIKTNNGFSNETDIVSVIASDLQEKYQDEETNHFRDYRTDDSRKEPLNFAIYSYAYNITRKRREEAMLENAKQAKYLSPKAQSVEVTTQTDDSGNKAVSQTIEYQGIDMFDESLYKKNANNARKAHPEIIKAANYVTEKEKDGGDTSKGIYNKLTPDQAADKILTIFSNNYYKQATKGLVHPNYVSSSIDIADPMSQQIYDTRYIGYQAGDDMYFLTKAQTKQQKMSLQNVNGKQ